MSLATAAATSAQPSYSHFGAFEAVSVEGGGEVVIRPSSGHSVRVVRGDPRAVEITPVSRRSLRIRCRPNACRNVSPRVEVSMPAVRALAVRGGGYILVERGFAPQRSLAVSVHGGGHVDSSDLRAGDVAASVSGGGHVETRAATSLAASVRGGGSISYYGSPRQVAVSTSGGGVVSPAER